MDSVALGEKELRSGEGARAPGARRFVCLQIGARENYAIARALHRRGALAALVTDVWGAHSGPLRVLPRRFGRALADRGHPELDRAPVVSGTPGALWREAVARVGGVAGWRRIMARNAWFQEMAIARLDRLGIGDGEATVFAYGYAAARILRYARRRGWRTVLGQIDPGPAEERIVAEEHRRRPGLAPDWVPAPEAYWRGWREEIELADRIVVNSGWSRQALLGEGVPEARLTTIPLAFEPPAEAFGFRRRYPARFDARRPLRALFLGQVNLRKGIGPLIDAARLMRGAPVEFHVVGPLQVSPPEGRDSEGRVFWHGPARRSEVHAHYREADVLLFPTLSDGFGLTQLEARAWRLPLIVTRRCGEVIEEGVTGLVVEPGSGDAIAAALGRCLVDPGWLQSAADATAPGERHDLDRLGRSLEEIA